MGAVVVLGAAYLPELMGGDTRTIAPAASTVPDAPPALTFEFDDLLRNSRVTADPEPYVSEPEPGAADGEPRQFLLQAASFRSREDAERLRAALLLLDMPARTNSTSLSNGTWHRVTVGPFDTRIQAERAMTRLRERDIAPIWTTR